MTFRLMQGATKKLFSTAMQEYHSQGFIPIVESHLSWLRRRESTKTETVEKVKAIKFQGDFYGLCQYLSIPAEVWPATMLLSGLKGPDQNTGELTSVTIPAKVDIDTLLQKHKKSF